MQKIEAALKELVFGAYPQYRDDKDINIMLTYILYGCYYAFMKTENMEMCQCFPVLQNLQARRRRQH